MYNLIVKSNFLKLFYICLKYYHFCDNILDNDLFQEILRYSCNFCLFIYFQYFIYVH